MSFRLIVRPAADRDIDDIAERIAIDNLSIGRRFYEAVWETIDLLGTMPRLGAPPETQNPGLQGLRAFGVKGFRNYLLFYLPIERGIDVVRIMHGAGDIDAILEGE